MKVPRFAALQPGFGRDLRSKAVGARFPDVSKKSRAAVVHQGHLRLMYDASLTNMAVSKRLLDGERDALRRPEEPDSEGPAQRGASRSSPLEKADGSRPSRSSPLEKADGSSPSRSSPLEKADGSRPSRGSPLEKADGSRPSRSSPLEKADGSRPSRCSPLEKADGSRPSRSSPLEKADGSSPSRSSPLEKADGSRPSRSSPLEKADGSSPSRGSPLEKADGSSPSSQPGVSVLMPPPPPCGRGGPLRAVRETGQMSPPRVHRCHTPDPLSLEDVCRQTDVQIIDHVERLWSNYIGNNSY